MAHEDEEMMMAAELEGVEAEVERPMTDDQLVSVCNEELGRSISGIGDEQDISCELDYYLGRLPGTKTVDTKDTRASSIVSMDVMDAIEATTAEVMQMYSADEIAYYQAEGPEDEENARRESEIVNYLFLEKYNGYVVLQTAVKNAFLHRNGVVKVYWDRRTRVAYETYEQVPAPMLAELVQPKRPNETVEIVEQIQDGVVSMGEDPETPELAAMMDLSVETFSFTLKRSWLDERPVAEIVIPEQVRVASDHDSPFLDNCRFCAHEKIESESSLIEQGYPRDLVEMLPSYRTNTDEVSNTSRSRNVTEIIRDSAHHSTRPVHVAECYIRIDYDGDGIAELRKVTISGETLLSNETIDTVPLIAGTGIIMPHKFQGISLYDRIKDIQDGKTDLLRSIVNGGKLSANPRIGILTGEVNVEDLLMSRVGGIVRVDRPESVVNLPNPEIPPSVFQTMSFLDQLRRERGGSAIDTAIQAQQVAGDTAHGIERTMSAMEMYNSMVAKTIGETLVRGIFLELHRLLRRFQQGSVNARVGGRWVQSTPSQWIERDTVAVQVGASVNERTRIAVAMAQIIETHRWMFENGSPVVDMERGYRALLDRDRALGIKKPEQYYVDPVSEEGQQKRQEQQQMKEQQRQKQEQMEAVMVEAQARMAMAEEAKAQAQGQANQLKAQVEQLKMQLKSVQDSIDNTLKANKQSDDFALEATKLELDARRDLNAQIQGNRNTGRL